MVLMAPDARCEKMRACIYTFQAGVVDGRSAEGVSSAAWSFPSKRAAAA